MENDQKKDTSVRSKEKERTSSEKSGSRSESKDSFKDKRRSGSSSHEPRKKSFHSRDRKRRRSRSVDSSTSAKNNGLSLFVSNLHSQLRESELEDKFGEIGKIASTTIIRDPFTKESRGFGFIVYENEDDTKEAINKFHNSELKGLNLRVELSKRKKARNKTPGKYIGNNKPRMGRYGDRRYNDRYDRDRRDRDRDDDRYYNRNRR